jgi:hypothetical protein
MARRRRYRRRARRNPTKNQWLLIGGLAAAGVVGYLVYRNTAKALPAGPSAGAVQTVTLAPGTLPVVTLPLAQAGAIMLYAPAGATLGTVTIAPTGILGAPASGVLYEYVAIAKGTATLTATYTDTAAVTQTSVIPITVS